MCLKSAKKKALNGYSYWYNFLDKGLINISMATFVSILIKKEAINICGLPCKDFLFGVMILNIQPVLRNIMEMLIWLAQV